MKQIQSMAFIGHGMEPFLQQVIDSRRIIYHRLFGCNADDQEIFDWIFYEAIKKECEKFGYKG